MNGQALYRRWRSQTFDQLIAQEHVTRTLQNALRRGRIAHAYLFCGPRGTGKTSTARILAKAVNCLAELAERPCNRCTRCEAVTAGRDLDLIEIDAASNRGIDEIRELRDKIAFAPNEGRYKVYVIDEVHMLTPEAFNALLKTLEEPPGHVIFVLATTEPQKIPATILSRCQRFDFRRVPLADLSEKIRHICEAEAIRIQPAAVEAIARRAGGSLRDAESLLDQLAAYGEAEITLEQVQDLLGEVSTSVVGDLVQAWLDADLAPGLKLINGLVDRGVDARRLHLEVIEYLRSLLLVQAGGDDRLASTSPEVLARMRQQARGLSLGRLVDGLRVFSQSESLARGEVRPQMPLELAFAQAVLLGAPAGEGGRAAAAPEPPATRIEPPAGGARAARGEVTTPASQVAGRRAMPATEPTRRKEQPTPAAAAAPEPPEGAAPTSLTLDWLSEKWPLVLQSVRAQDKRLEALLRGARPAQAGDGRVVLEAESSFHREHILMEKNLRVVRAVLEELTGAPCQVECVPGGRRPAQRSRGSAASNPMVQQDPVVRYAVEDLGAQVGDIQKMDKGRDHETGKPARNASASD
jgi:DNA polymerase-3 subunit gamma/tau